MVPDLIIFDCDGVLVDSEHIAVRIDQNFLLDLGIFMSIDKIIENFVGKSNEYFESEIARQIGLELPPNWKTELDHRYKEAFAKELNIGRAHV